MNHSWWNESVYLDAAPVPRHEAASRLTAAGLAGPVVWRFLTTAEFAFDPDQPRGEGGRWSATEHLIEARDTLREAEKASRYHADPAYRKQWGVQPVPPNPGDLTPVRQAHDRAVDSVVAEKAREAEAKHGPASSPAVGAAASLYERFFHGKQGIAPIRDQLAPALAALKPPQVAEVVRRVGYTPERTKRENVARLLSNAEAMQITHLRSDTILEGV